MDTEKQDRKINWGRGNVPTWLKMLVAVAVVLLLTLVLFRVRTFEVSGNSRYSLEEITQASGITDGDILLGVNKTRTASRLLVKLPYLEKVVIRKSLPGTIQFEVEECSAQMIAVSEFSTYWTMNAEGKLLEEVDAPDESENSAYPVIVGPLLTLPTGGDIAVFNDSASGALGITIANAVSDTGLSGKISEINVEAAGDVYLVYEKRLEVHLGDGSDAEYRLQYFKAILSQLDETASGLVDISFSAGEQAIFHPIVS